MIPLLPDFPAPAPALTAIQWPALEALGVELLLQREDRRDPVLGGNKWYKLLGHLQAARAQGASRVLSFGGAWSNHLYALAAAGARYGFPTLGLVRGAQDTAMLADCRRWGMHILPLSFGDYRRRHDPAFLALLAAEYPDAYLLPEGGAGEAGLSGFAPLAQELALTAAGRPSVVAVAMGTGTTVAGLAAALPKSVALWGFPVLPLPGIEAKLAQYGSALQIWHGLVDAGYGRLSPELAAFLSVFEREQGVSLDPIYTVKLLWALDTLAKTDRLPRASRIIALHSGGLQGRRGFDLPLPAWAA